MKNPHQIPEEAKFQMFLAGFTRGAAITIVFFLLQTIPSQAVDLGSAVIVHPAGFSGPEKKAVQMLAEEAEKRSKVLWPATRTVAARVAFWTPI